MYCTACGTEIKETTRFCPVCGASSFQERRNTEISLAEEAPVEVVSSSAPEGIKAELEMALEVIFKIENAVQRKADFDERRIAIEKKKKEIAEELTTPQVIGFILVVIIPTIIGYSEDLITAILVFVFALLAFGVLINPIIKIFSSKEGEAEQYYREHMDELNREEEIFLNDFGRYCESDEVAFARNLVPEEYFDSDSVQFFIKMFNDKRADTFKEAVNLYEEYLHREYMETMQMQQLSMQDQQLQETQKLSTQMQQQSAYMQQISQNTKATAKAAKVNAFIDLAYGHKQTKQLKKQTRQLKSIDRSLR